MERKRGISNAHSFREGRAAGRGSAELHHNYREDGREFIKYDLKYDLNKKHTSSLFFSLP